MSNVMVSNKQVKVRTSNASNEEKIKITVRFKTKRGNRCPGFRGQNTERYEVSSLDEALEKVRTIRDKEEDVKEITISFEQGNGTKFGH